MPNYEHRCKRGHVTESYAGYEETIVQCGVCDGAAERLPCQGVQIINRTGDLGRPVTWDEKRKRENNARVQETVTNNSKRIAQETGDKTAYKQHVKR